MENNLLYIALSKYYQNEEKMNYLLKYLKYEKISLRIIDWFVTNYSKKYDTMYYLYKNNNSISLEGETIDKPFNVFHSYKSQLKSYSKRNFDPFCRRNRVDFNCNDENISTTICQLNFFRWSIDNLVIEFIILNYENIETDMNDSIQLIRKNYVKSSERKKRQELSLSASRGLNRHIGPVVITFD